MPKKRENHLRDYEREWIEKIFNPFIQCQTIDAATIIHELEEYKILIQAIPVTEVRFYTGLNEFSDGIYNPVHDKLHHYDFQNGKPTENTIEKRPYAAFWWALYGALSGIIYRYPCNGDHHACTKDRQTALLLMVDSLIDMFKK